MRAHLQGHPYHSQIPIDSKPFLNSRLLSLPVSHIPADVVSRNLQRPLDASNLLLHLLSPEEFLDLLLRLPITQPRQRRPDKSIKQDLVRTQPGIDPIPVALDVFPPDSLRGAVSPNHPRCMMRILRPDLLARGKIEHISRQCRILRSAHGRQRSIPAVDSRRLEIFLLQCFVLILAALRDDEREDHVPEPARHS